MKYSVLSKYRSELMGAAMLWVMLFHAVDLNFGVKSLNYLRSIGFGGVDVFIFLSAMGLAMSLDRKEQDFSTFMSRRCGRILPVYYLVVMPYTLFCILRGTAPASALIWNASLLGYWVRAKGAFNWYVVGILTFYALTPWCFRRLKCSAHREVLTAFGVALSFVVCQILMQDGYWFHLDIAYRFPVFFMGLLIGLYIREDRSVGWKGAVFWVLAFLMGRYYLVAMERYSGQGIHLPLCHLFAFTTVPLCLGVCWCFAHLPLGPVRKVLGTIGEYSLEIYMLNASFFTERVLLQQYLDSGPNHRLFYAIIIPVNLVLGVLLHHGMQAGRKALAGRGAAT